MRDLNHLEEDQLIRAVVDESDLPSEAQDHLAGCPSCQGRREALDRDLIRLGEMARQYAPSPRRGLLRFEEKPGWGVAWGWKKGFAAGVLVGWVLLFAFWLSPLPWTPDRGKPADRRELVEAERLMMEVRVLEENPLSPFHRFILGGPDSGLDDGFLDFVSPSFKKKGAQQSQRYGS